jgi:hypothetical protein
VGWERELLTATTFIADADLPTPLLLLLLLHV